MMTKTDLAKYLIEHGLVVEGDETHAELSEAYSHVAKSLRAGRIGVTR